MNYTIRDMVEAARRLRNDTARAKDELGVTGEGTEEIQRAVMVHALAARLSNRQSEQLAGDYSRALREVQRLNEMLYDATGKLADATAEVVRRAPAPVRR